VPAPSATFTSGFSTTTTPKSVAVTASAGQLLVVWAASENSTTTVNTPTGGSLTYTLRQSVAVANDCATYCWTATATGNVTVQATASAGGDTWGLFVEVWPAGTTVGASNKTNLTTSGAPSLPLTTTAANSAISCWNSDFNAVTTARTWLTVNGITPTSGNGLENYYEAVSLAATHYHAYWNDAGAAGSKTVGLSAPTNQAYSIIALELIGAVAGGTPTPDIIVAPAAPRRTLGSGITLDHATVIQPTAADTPAVYVQPSIGYRRAQAGSAQVAGSRADVAASAPIEPPTLSATTRPPAPPGAVWLATPRADPDPTQNQPDPAPLVAAGRPLAQAGQVTLSTPRADPPAAAPVETPITTTGRPAGQAGTVWLIPPRADPDPGQNQPAQVPTIAAPAVRPTPGSAFLSPPLPPSEPPVEQGAVVALRQPPPALGSAWVTGSRTDPPAVIDQPGPPPLIVGRSWPATSGTAVLLAGRADPAVDVPPVPEPIVVAGRPLVASASPLIGGSRADSPAAVPEVIVSTALPRPSRGVALLARSTFTPPPPVLILRPPLYAPGVRLPSPGSSLLTRLTQFTGHVCPPPTARPNTGTTANSTGDITARPYTGITPVC
jgi:hypothetical protein